MAKRTDPQSPDEWGPESEECRRKLHGILRRDYGSQLSQDEIEEISQEAICRAIENRAKYDGDIAAWCTWVIGIAWRVAKEYLRRRGRSVLDNAAATRLIAEVVEVREPRDSARLARMLKVLPVLSESQRKVLFLHICREMSIRDIARLLERKEDTLRAEKRRALTTLRERIEQDPDCR